MHVETSPSGTECLEILREARESGERASYVPDEDWRTIDRTLTALARRRAAHDLEEGRWLLAAKRKRLHARLGFATFAEYVARRLGYDARTTAERLRVAAALGELPRTREVLAAGLRSWSAIREITRVATRTTESAWLEATENKTVREIEQMVSGLPRGSEPGEPNDPSLGRRTIRLELSPEVYALFHEAPR